MKKVFEMGAIAIASLGVISPCFTAIDSLLTPPVLARESFWHPVARIDDPEFPMTVKLVNQTAFNLDYDLTDNDPDTIPQDLPPDTETTLIVPDSDANISISYFDPDWQGDNVGFSFQIEIETNNTVTFFIQPAIEPDLPGDATGKIIDIQSTGGIFVY